MFPCACFVHAMQDLPEGIAWHPKKGTLVFGGGHSRRLRILVPCDEEQAQSKPATQTVSGQVGAVLRHACPVAEWMIASQP